MPEMDRQAVLDWVSACAPGLPVWSREPVRAVEDDSEVHTGLVALGHALDAPDLAGVPLGQCMQAAGAGHDLHDVLLQLGPARLLRMLRWLGQEGGDERALILKTLLDETHGSPGALRAAIEALHRRELLQRIFDETRLDALLEATRKAKDGVSA